MMFAMIVSSTHASIATVLIAATMAVSLEAQEWTQTSGPAGGQVLSVGAHHDVIFAGVPHGLHRSLDGGEHWQPVALDVGGLPGVTVLASDERVIFAGTADAVFARSYDEGETWTMVAPPAPGAQPFAAQFDNDRLFLVTAGSGGFSVWKSPDDGDTWSGMQLPSGGFGPQAIFVEDDFILIGASDAQFGGLGVTILRSNDGGESFTLVPLGFLNSGLVDAFGRVGGALFVATGKGVFRSVNEGMTWTITSGAGGGGQGSQQLASFAAISGDLYLAGTRLDGGQQDVGPGLWRSEDLGDTWARVDDDLPPTLTQTAQIAGDPQRLLVVGGYGLFRSLDDAQSWHRSMEGIVAATVWAMASNGSAIFANPVNTDEVWRHQPSQPQWQRHDISAEAQPLLELWADGTTSVFAGSQSEGIFRSLDNGETWNAVNAGVPDYNGTAGLQFREIEAFTRNGQAILAGTGLGREFANGNFVISGAGAIRSTDGGQTWQPARTGLPLGGFNNFGEPMFDPIFAMGTFDGVVFAGHFSRGIYRSTNSGTSWTASNGGIPLSSGVSINAFARQGQTIFAGGLFTNSVGVWKSTDGGSNWSPTGPGLPVGFPVQSLVVRGEEVFAGTGFAPDPRCGAFRSGDGGATWQRVGTQLDGIPVLHLAVVDGALYGGTAGRSVWRLQEVAPAVLTDFVFAFGSSLRGGLPELAASDDSYLHARSQFGFSALEPNIIDLVSGFESPMASPQAIDFHVESRINNPGGSGKARIKNWSTRSFEQVSAFSTAQQDTIHTFADIDPADRVRASDGRIEFSTRISVIATFSAAGFDAWFDEVAVGVQ